MFREGLTNCFLRGSGKRCRPKLGRVLFGGSDCFNKEGGRAEFLQARRIVLHGLAAVVVRNVPSACGLFFG